jgi:hypothetical protein
MSDFDELKKDVEMIAKNRYLSFQILVEDNTDFYLSQDYEEWIDCAVVPWIVACKEQGLITDQERAILGSIFWDSWSELHLYIKNYKNKREGGVRGLWTKVKRMWGR